MEDNEEILHQISSKLLRILDGHNEVDNIEKLIKRLDISVLKIRFFNLKRDHDIQEGLTLLELVTIFNNDISEQIEKESDPRKIEDISIIKVNLDLVRDEILCKLDPTSCLSENNLRNENKLKRLIGALSLRGGTRKKGKSKRRFTKMKN
jgi:hypothetical protein